MKRFACQDIIPGCEHVFTGADDQSVLDQVIAHAAVDHGLVKPPLALVELVVATTHTLHSDARPAGTSALVGAQPLRTTRCPTVDALAQNPRTSAAVAIPATRPWTADLMPSRRCGARPPVPHERADPVRSRQTDGHVRDRGPHWRDRSHDSYRHECVFYDGVDEFLAMPSSRSSWTGFALDQPVMVAVAEPRLQRRAGGAGSRTPAGSSSLDMAELGP